MSTRTLLPALGLVFTGLVAPAFATPIGPSPAPCAPGTLASYILLGATGCSIGGQVAFRDFAFAVLSAGGGADPIPAAAIFVTPAMVGARRSLTFTSPAFTVSGTQSISYLIAYDIDPHPILFAFDDEIFTDTPVFPGLASVTTNLCIGSPFGGTILVPTCSGTPATLNVFHNGITFDLVDATSFTPTADLGVRNTIGLFANGASASFTGFRNRVDSLPEPATWVLIGSGLLGVRLSRRRFRR